MVDTEILAELSHRAKQLNERSDTLSKSIDALNDQLGAMNLGLEFWLENNPLSDSGLRGSDSGKSRTLIHLGFCKLEDKWQLAVRRTTIDYVWNRADEVEDEIRDEERTVALSKAPRDIRLLAVDSFDDLLKGLNRLAEEKLKVIERAATLAKPQ